MSGSELSGVLDEPVAVEHGQRDPKVIPLDARLDDSSEEVKVRCTDTGNADALVDAYGGPSPLLPWLGLARVGRSALGPRPSLPTYVRHGARKELE